MDNIQYIALSEDKTNGSNALKWPNKWKCPQVPFAECQRTPTLSRTPRPWPHHQLEPKEQVSRQHTKEQSLHNPAWGMNACYTTAFSFLQNVLLLWHGQNRNAIVHVAKWCLIYRYSMYELHSVCPVWFVTNILVPLFPRSICILYNDWAYNQHKPLWGDSFSSTYRS